MSLLDDLLVANVTIDIDPMLNTISSLYEGKELIRDYSADTIICPVCKKAYKNQKSAEKHLEKRECFRPADVFGWTWVEREAFDLAAEIKETGRFSLAIFRKSSLYLAANRFVIFCSAEEVIDPLLYYAYVRDVHIGKRVQPARVLQVAVDESKAIHGYRGWIQQHPEHNAHNDEVFLQRLKHLDEEANVPATIVGGISRGHVSLSFLRQRGYLDDVGEWPGSSRFALQGVMEKLGITE